MRYLGPYYTLQVGLAMAPYQSEKENLPWTWTWTCQQTRLENPVAAVEQSQQAAGTGTRALPLPLKKPPPSPGRHPSLLSSSSSCKSQHPCAHKDHDLVRATTRIAQSPLQQDPIYQANRRGQEISERVDASK